MDTELDTGPRRRPSFWALLAVPLSFACVSNLADEAYADLEFALQASGDEAQRPEMLWRLNRMLADERGGSELALQRFHAAFLLAKLHTAASLDAPFLTQETTLPSSVGAIGEDDRVRSGLEHPSPVAHLVASIYHASRGRALYARAERAETEAVGVLPDALESVSLEDADVSLQIMMTVAYARLGFRDEVSKILAFSPDLLEIESCLAFLHRHDVPFGLRPWVCEAVSHHLRSTDEQEAYRFAVFAVEGAERFGYALPATAVAGIEDWIVNGASVVFVCPASHTEYLPGQRSSPLSGVAHIDYIGVVRP